MPLRVLSWNVRSLRDGSRDVAAVLRRLAPDLVVVQEAPRLLGWRTSRWLLARRAGLRVLTPAHAHGNLLLGGPDAVRRSSGTVVLPKHRGLHRRAAAWAVVEVRGRAVVLAGTHLDLRPAPRLDSARRVRAGLPAGPLVLGADVNDVPGSAAWQVLAEGLRAVDGPPTFPARAPRRRIDGVFTSLRVLRSEVVDVGEASDHRGVLVELD